MVYGVKQNVDEVFVGFCMFFYEIKKKMSIRKNEM